MHIPFTVYHPRTLAQLWLGWVLGFIICLPGIAAEQEPESELRRLNEVHQGSLMLKTDKPGQYRLAPLQETDADIRITGPIARTVLRQRFKNPTSEWTEAIYAFPLPEEAAVDHMRMRIGQRIVEGVIQEKAQARKTYERARLAGQRTALVEQQRPNLFTTAVANIPPNGEITVEIEYQQLLHWRDNQFSLRFPMTITPRYRPAATGRLQQAVDLSAANQAGWSVLPGELPNVVDLSQSDESNLVENPVILNVVLDSGFALDQVTSRYHRITQNEVNGVQHIRLARGPVPANQDFELVWTPAPQANPQAAFFTEASQAGKEEAGYGLLMLMPPTAAFDQQLPLLREVIYVIDTSGSMSGESIRAAKRALANALAELKSGDYFNVIEFNHEARALFAAPRPVDLDSTSRAQAFVTGLEADGGTEMLTALQQALNQGNTRPGYLRQIVFITDGAVANEAQLFRHIHQGLGEARLFTVGIGSAPNSHFMTEAARMGRGSFTYIGNVSEVENKMQALLQRLAYPALTDIELQLPVTADALPSPIPDLYRGEPLTVVMRLDDWPEVANLKGRVGSLDWQTQLTLGAKQGKPQAGLGVLWARSKIAWWRREGVRGLDQDKVRSGILDIALKHHLVSAYTSLVAVDKTPVRPPEKGVDAYALKNNKPKGWQAPVHQSVPMAVGSTPSLLLMLLGAPLMLLSSLWWWLAKRWPANEEGGEQ